MTKNMIAAVIVSIMCSGAHASDKALETLNRAAGDEVIRNITITEPVARNSEQAGARGGTTVYTNDYGCVVTAEQRANGTIIYVQDGNKQQATLGFRNDLRSGDIFSYCSPAKPSLNGGTLALSCGEQNNGGYSTRGAAVIEMNGGITGVTVEGEVKRALGWKTDTRISCGGLKPAASRNGAAKKGANVVPGTYQFNDGYTSAKLTVPQTQQGAAGKLNFSLSAVTAAGHTGDIEGVATAGQGGSFVFRGTGGCAVTLKPEAGKITVSGANDSCEDYLGMNVFVDGEYTLN